MVEDVADGEGKIMGSFRGTRSLKSTGSSSGLCAHVLCDCDNCPNNS